MALTHEFAWSASRATNFKECRRQHYFQYYGGWLGWERKQPPERQHIYQLAKLTRMPMVAGDAVHQSLAYSFRMKHVHECSEDEILKRALDILRSK
ncbi:MAG: PD-(D/E)XK nuclease family protein, partial [Myxococcota bacterium]